MYDASPDNKLVLDYEKTKKFLTQFDWNMINAFGFYGGEPSIDMELYDRFIALIPKQITNKFVITNGTWSNNYNDTVGFLEWCYDHKFHIIVSSTPEHVAHQNRKLLEQLTKESKDGIELKKPDEIHAQGRAKGLPNIITDCKHTCQRTDRNIRLGLKPDGNIVYQNCHGEYHIVQNYEQPFEGILNRTQRIVADCLAIKRLK
jgi:hypothetical protein